MTARIHSIETLGALDGPGVRTVIFFQGCPMRCLYCHNADMLSGVGEQKSIEELAAFCLRYKNYYGENGGVTLSGGEPLLQAKAALALIEALKKEGIHTALDTAGAPFAPETLAAADLVILDVKHTVADEFFSLTKYKIDDTLKTLAYLQEHKKRFWVRQVIVTGITDGEAQIRKLKELARNAEKIELLPYHKMGSDKWEKAGLSYSLKGIEPPSPEVMRRLDKILSE